MKTPPEHNEHFMVAMQPSRKRRKIGELFRIQIVSGEYIYGRVILLDVSSESDLIRGKRPPWEPCPGFNLIYIYNSLCKNNVIPDVASLSSVHFQYVVNRTCWTRGYFQPIRYDLPQAYQVFPRHLFCIDTREVLTHGVQYVCDERGNPAEGDPDILPDMNVAGCDYFDWRLRELAATMRGIS